MSLKIEKQGVFTDRHRVRCASGSAPDSPAGRLSLQNDAKGVALQSVITAFLETEGPDHH